MNAKSDTAEPSKVQRAKYGIYDDGIYCPHCSAEWIGSFKSGKTVICRREGCNKPYRIY